MLWFVLAGMAAFAVLAALWPLLRGSAGAKADAAANEAAFYKAQLEEIRRDVERGLLPQGEAESARAEAARRLIAAAPLPAPAPQPAAPHNRFAAAALIALGLPAIAFPLYSFLGQPRMPDQPLAARMTGGHTNGEIEAAVAAVEARLIAKPDDGKGWSVIAPVYMRLQRYGDAAHAYAEALRLDGEDPLRRAAYGEALVAVAGGVVTDEARQAFDRALAEQPGQPQARFYLALGAEQDGKKAEAIHAYEQIIAEFGSRRAVAGRGERAACGAQGRAGPGGGERGRARRHSRGPAANDRGNGEPARHPARQQWRQRRRLVAPYSRLCGAA